MGILYIVATPIGNLEDVTLRAIKILTEVDIIISEDTRVTGKLMNFINRYNIEQRINNKELKTKDNTGEVGDNPNISYRLQTPKLISYHHHSDERKRFEILKLLLEGKNIALVTDAGTPGIQDPGNELVSFILESEPDIKIVPIPGASSLTAAISVCGFNTNSFIFLGFMKKKGHKKLFEKLIKGDIKPFVFFESPHRIIKTLNEIRNIFGEDTNVFVGRELTKLHETIYRGKVAQVQVKLSDKPVKGEIVAVVWFEKINREKHQRIS